MKYKPSQLGAASLLLGIKIGFASGLTRLTNEQKQKLIYNNEIKKLPQLWDEEPIVNITHLEFETDIKSPYIRLITKLNTDNTTFQDL